MSRDRMSPSSRRDPLSGEDERASRDVSADAERIDDGMELTQEQRDQILRDEALQNMLPTPPRRPGVHWFWASTSTEAGHSIAWYKRLGYRLVSISDPLLKGWADANMRSASGTYADCITVNEMVLMKVSSDDYQRYMRIVHHDKPNQEAQRSVDALANLKASVGAENIRSVAKRGESDGFSELERSTKVRAPQSFD